jgi:hypothetical protein
MRLKLSHETRIDQLPIALRITAKQRCGAHAWRPGFSTFATAGADVHMHQCLVATLALTCARKKRIISRLASGPRASV